MKQYLFWLRDFHLHLSLKQLFLLLFSVRDQEAFVSQLNLVGKRVLEEGEHLKRKLH